MFRASATRGTILSPAVHEYSVYPRRRMTSRTAVRQRNRDSFDYEYAYTMATTTSVFCPRRLFRTAETPQTVEDTVRNRERVREEQLLQNSTPRGWYSLDFQRRGAFQHVFPRVVPGHLTAGSRFVRWPVHL